jgi:isoleucyl-tRNA synthetase
VKSKPNDYRATVFLPRTEFPMKAELPKREPDMLRRWDQMELWRRLREDSKGRAKFLLHDGPPYANANLHIGHALNKILKDVVNRCWQMLGYDANYVPGWDCHGLPIEWKIEEQYRAAGRDKDQVPINEFRRECREFAAHWMKVQQQEFRRLGVEGEWARRYATMDAPAEAQIVREIGKFLMNGALYRGSKPVLWSVVERTALAEAELEYHERTSTTVHVRFPVIQSALAQLKGASVLIWTTTPWTMPGNRAICFGPEFEYAVVEVQEPGDGSLARKGERYVVAAALAEAVAKDAKIARQIVLATFKGSELAGAVCAHPLRGKGYEFDVPLLPGEHVTLDAGTGLVHTAPGHGQDDFEIGRRFGLEVPQTVGEDSAFFPHVPLFAGLRVLTDTGKAGEADGAVCTALEAAGMLLARGSVRHDYPHSWRSKAPLIFRNTPQWFISMETTGLRRTALEAIGKTRWVPASGEARMRGMIETRPDWCISRQRAWGVPIAVFVDKRTGEPLRDQAVTDRIADAIEREGADIWFSSPPERFLGPGRDPADYEQIRDIVDVWFESGATHSFVLEARPELGWPASLYLEGSDQHRGWFHSSLLESCGTRGRAPYDAVLTHGFVLDEQGRKMSKSLGNVVAPQEVVDKFGADILRLWVVSSDYSEDLRIGADILQHQVDMYRRLRNTMRYLIGNLDGFGEEERMQWNEMPELERWVLHRLHELDRMLRKGIAEFDFHAPYTALHQFCATDLSAFYFDVRKDRLYCDRSNDPGRRACRTVLDAVYSCLTAWLAPVLCFTAEEAWLARNPDPKNSVHLRIFPALPEEWRDPRLAERWEKVRTLRRVVTGALEIARAERKIGSSLQASPIVYAEAAYLTAYSGLDAAEIWITSGALLRPLAEAEGREGLFMLPEIAGIKVELGLAGGDKCGRCWRVLPEVSRSGGDLCGRCDAAVAARTTPAG